ncbi:MAG: SLC13 family permease [Pirellulaceae bacterium]
MQFIQISLPYAVISLLIAIAVLRFLFRNDLPWQQSTERQRELDAKVAALNPMAVIDDPKLVIRSSVILLGTVVGFVFAQQLGVGMDFIAIIGGTAALVFAGKGVDDAIKKVNWTVILFFTGLFVIIGCIRHTGALTLVSQQVIELSGNELSLLLPLLSVFAAVASSIVDNIPVAATLIPIVNQISDSGIPAEPLWWALVICCNLGGNGTPIGSISCVIAIHDLKSHANEHIGWGTFLKIGGTIMLFQVIGAIAYVMLLHEMGWIPPIP